MEDDDEEVDDGAVDRWLSRLVDEMTLEVAISLLLPNRGNLGNWSLKRGNCSLNLGCANGCSLRRCWSRDDCKNPKVDTK